MNQRDPAFSDTLCATSAPMPISGSQVLLVDDSCLTRELLRNLLESAGHVVQEVENGDQALQVLKTQRFDFVVSDVQMPRLDGVGLTRAIRGDAALAHLPVVLVTSAASPAGRQRGLEAGANAYFSKSSFDPAQLAGILRSFP